MKGKYIMNDFYQTLFSINEQVSSITMTVTDGKYAGEKAIFEKNKLIFLTPNSIFLAKHAIHLLPLKETSVQVFHNTSVFCEVLCPEKKLIICGAGHVSIPIIKMGKMLGFHVTAIDDRPSFADNARKANADQVYCCNFVEILDQIQGDANTYFIIVTRGHRYDLDCLRKILTKKYAYLGMMSSKSRAQKARALLLEEGFSESSLSQLHAPIGLNIRAETPEEIAISIMSEIVQCKNTSVCTNGFTREIQSELSAGDQQDDRQKILATIISKKGPAPREIGTKMLIHSDGTTVGTIGGGCMEAEVIRKARQLMIQNVTHAIIYDVDMTGRAGDEGMVCGGIQQLLLEPLS